MLFYDQIKKHLTCPIHGDVLVEVAASDGDGILVMCPVEIENPIASVNPSAPTIKRCAESASFPDRAAYTDELKRLQAVHEEKERLAKVVEEERRKLRKK